MIKAHWDSKLREVVQNRNSLLVIVAGLLLLLVLLSLVLIKQAGQKERILIVPPLLEKSFWVDTNRVSATYLEQMASFFAQLALTVSPSSVDKNHEVLLQYTHPLGYGKLKADLLQKSEKIKAQHVSTVFYPVSFDVNTQDFSVIITGDFMRLIGQEKLPALRKRYRVNFVYNQGQLTVNTFKEIEDV